MARKIYNFKQGFVFNFSIDKYIGHVVIHEENMFKPSSTNFFATDIRGLGDTYSPPELKLDKELGLELGLETGWLQLALVMLLPFHIHPIRQFDFKRASYAIILCLQPLLIIILDFYKSFANVMRKYYPYFYKSFTASADIMGIVFIGVVVVCRMGIVFIGVVVASLQVIKFISKHGSTTDTAPSSSSLLSISWVQAWFYFNNYQNDPFYLRYAVFLVIFFDMTHQSDTSYLVTNFNNPIFFTTCVWSLLAKIFFNGFSGFLIQWQVPHCKDNVKAVLMPDFCIYACMTVFGIIGLVKINTFEELKELHRLSISVNALATIGNVLITCCSVRCIYLPLINSLGITNENDSHFEVVINTNRFLWLLV
ncbi:hypothetical protein K435DRAFT_810479 [Dendrothele bispora CBS 962.96]|uniref:Uncharacterized protein n=1 Tax=Dendrothele bispora (strain CBS 962.96) TaxID=1314807 RepID=A0A4S8KV08_DENBC|nr:hypothetical protein K435DRAFT_810479 [Dendrothele bispora CBS 962.96]